MLIVRTHISRVGIALTLAVLLILTFALTSTAKAAGMDERVTSSRTDAQQPADLPEICTGVTAIPVEECGALVALYSATGGDDWFDNTGWLDVTGGKTPCDWSGVICESGHVTGLQLTGNRLLGKLPRTLGHLDSLRELQFAKNGLSGNAPLALCELTDTVQGADFGYNQLAPRAARTIACLDTMDPDWAATQTVPPADLRITGFYADGFDLAWTPVVNRSSGGYYEVSVKNSFGGVYQLHGVTTDTATGSYRIDGLPSGQSFFIRVHTVSTGEDGQPAEVRSVPAQFIGVTDADEELLLAVFISADNNLSPYVRSIVERIRIGTEINPNATAIVLADRRGSDNTDVVRIENGVITSTDAVMDEWGVNELDVADPAVLTWFLRYARLQAPADRTAVSLIGHGVGPAPEVAWLPPTLPGQPPVPPQDGIPPLPQSTEFTPADVTDGSYISTVELGRALLAATDDGANPFDILFFDQCFQGNIDVLYEVRAAADIFIASPNYAWLIAPYAKYIAQLAPAATNEQIAQSIIERYEGSLNVHHPNAIFWLHSVDIEVIATAIGNLGGALTSALAAGQGESILAAARDGLYVDTTQCGNQKFVLDPPDELLGANSFAHNLRDAFEPGDIYGVNAAAGELINDLSVIHSESITGSPYIAPQQTWEYTDHITMLAPLSRRASAAMAWRASLYTEQMPVTAVWGPNPSERVVVSQTFAFVQDHGWDEFIGEWYSEPLTPTVGTWCYYTPPSLVVDEDGETLAMMLGDAGDGALTLFWDEPMDVDPVAYWLFAKGPLNVERELIAVLEPDVFELTLTDLDAGEHHFMVAAMDAETVVVAYTAVMAKVIERVSYSYLPLVAGP